MVIHFQYEKTYYYSPLKNVARKLFADLEHLISEILIHDDDYYIYPIMPRVTITFKKNVSMTQSEKNTFNQLFKSIEPSNPNCNTYYVFYTN